MREKLYKQCYSISMLSGSIGTNIGNIQIFGKDKIEETDYEETTIADGCRKIR